jgi:hypothetical protein
MGPSAEMATKHRDFIKPWTLPGQTVVLVDDFESHQSLFVRPRCFRNAIAVMNTVLLWLSRRIDA